MSEIHPLWEHRQIEALGISIEVYLPWPYGSRIGADRGNIYQDIADTGGLVFLQYGEEARLENFVAMQSDLVTTASIIGDETLFYCGQQARRLTLRAIRQSLGVYRNDPGEGLTHGVSPGTRKIISTIGFHVGSRPVLFGYEISEEQQPFYQPLLQRILNSARVST